MEKVHRKCINSIFWQIKPAKEKHTTPLASSFSILRRAGFADQRGDLALEPLVRSLAVLFGSVAIAGALSHAGTPVGLRFQAKITVLAHTDSPISMGALLLARGNGNANRPLHIVVDDGLLWNERNSTPTSNGAIICQVEMNR